MNATADAAQSSPDLRLTDDQLREVMRLIKGANSVELKLTVPAMAHRATVQGLPIDPVEAQPRQVFFFDTPDLKLYDAGVVVRARRIAGGKGDTVVKLRPVEPEALSADIRRDPSFNVEVDALPGGFVCSASFKGRSNGQAIRDAVSGKTKLSKIFSKQQRAFYRAHAPQGLDLDSLLTLGPTFLLKSRFDVHMGLDDHAAPRSMVAEVWLYPDGSRILELSTKCLPKDALGVAAETRAYLVSKNVPTNAAQETKTRTALEFYARMLAEELGTGTSDQTTAAAPAPRRRERSTAAAGKSSAKPGPKSGAEPSAKPAAKATAKPAAKSVAKPAARPATRATSTRSTSRTTGQRRRTPRQSPPNDTTK